MLTLGFVGFVVCELFSVPWSNLLFLFPISIDELEEFEKSIYNKLVDLKNDVERICELSKPEKNAIRMNNNIAFQYF